MWKRRTRPNWQIPALILLALMVSCGPATIPQPIATVSPSTVPSRAVTVRATEPADTRAQAFCVLKTPGCAPTRWGDGNKVRKVSVGLAEVMETPGVSRDEWCEAIRNALTTWNAAAEDAGARIRLSAVDEQGQGDIKILMKYSTSPTDRPNTDVHVANCPPIPFLRRWLPPQIDRATIEILYGFCKYRTHDEADNSDEHDPQSVILHELGHALGLEHQNSDCSAVMAGDWCGQQIGQCHEGNWVCRQLSSGDICGLRYLYGAAPCAGNPTPACGMPTPANRFVVDAAQDWQNTGVPVAIGDTVEIRRVDDDKKWSYRSGIEPHGACGDPGGYICSQHLPAAQCVEKMPDAVTGSLVARIGTGLRFVGCYASFVAVDSGWLELAINDFDLSDNFGAINVQIITSGTTKPAAVPTTTLPAVTATATIPAQPTVFTYAQVVVPAGTTTGTPTGFRVRQGDVITFVAPGKWCWGGYPDCSTADGTPGRPGPEEGETTLRGEPFGKLIGRVGDWLFPIGAHATVTMATDGELLLLMSDRLANYHDNSGSLTVEISLGTSPAPSAHPLSTALTTTTTPIAAQPTAVTHAQVVVPAGTTTGTPTGFRVRQGDVITFVAPGKWCWGYDPDCSTADGTQDRPGPGEGETTLKGEPFGKLIGRVGDWMFPIGGHAVVTMATDGDLLLLMNDRLGYYSDNSGSITVEVTTEGR